MNWLDIVIIVAIAIPTFIGLRAGIIKLALSLAGVIVGVVLAGHYYVPLSSRLSFITDENMAKIAAFVIIMIGVLVIAGVIAGLLKWVTSIVMLGWLNSLGGAVFGLLLGAIFCGALLATWVKFQGVEEPIATSMLTPVLSDYFPLVLALLPEEFDVVHSFFQ